MKSSLNPFVNRGGMCFLYWSNSWCQSAQQMHCEKTVHLYISVSEKGVCVCGIRTLTHCTASQYHPHHPLPVARDWSFVNILTNIPWLTTGMPWDKKITFELKNRVHFRMQFPSPEDLAIRRGSGLQTATLLHHRFPRPLTSYKLMLEPPTWIIMPPTAAAKGSSRPNLPPGHTWSITDSLTVCVAWRGVVIPPVLGTRYISHDDFTRVCPHSGFLLIYVIAGWYKIMISFSIYFIMCLRI